MMMGKMDSLWKKRSHTRYKKVVLPAMSNVIYNRRYDL
jgi:hypothetical protein